ncbi:MAG: diaminopimelate decarboxylase [Myxococcota bacterium]|nr:diaminopimelate decarboxylase [Myxococcota bacterium]
MDHFQRRDGEMYAEEVPLRRIAEAVGTPTYVYSKATILRHYKVFDEAWDPTDHLTCYAVKASSNLAILSLLAGQGAGFDIVSGGELQRVIRAGGDPAKVVFSGVGQTAEEIADALDAGILSFNVESEAELQLIDAIARERGTRAPVSLRINPNVDPESHPYISTGLQENKFGIPWDRATELLQRAHRMAGINLVGLDCHIGSQLEAIEPLVDALKRLVGLLDAIADAGIKLTHLDIGGGLGIPYGDSRKPPTPAEYANVLREIVGDRGLRIILEPGRVIMGNAGILLMRVLLNKQTDTKRFVVVDAAMNDAIRPALYGAYHTIEPVAEPVENVRSVDVVGPICESGDFLARDREFPDVEPDDLLLMRSLGAYGFVMSSNYNSRRRPAEVLVDGDEFHVIRGRETLEDLWRGEVIP